jgi:hypothetical protein
MAREVVIRAVLNGFIVRCGCQEVVFKSLFDMTAEINKYYTDPEVVEKEYQEKAINKPSGGVQDVTAATSNRIYHGLQRENVVGP